MRAVIYARYSSDAQDERSIADQVALCREYAKRQGHSVVAVYEDASVSGASMHGRPGIQLLLGDAGKRAFDIVLTESMSRIGRDQEDRAGIRKRLGFYSVTIATPADGVVTPLVDGIRAVIDSQQLEDLKHHTRRGMRGRVREGRSAGGRTYGYTVLPPESDGHGRFKRGGRVVNEVEAQIVRRIFSQYVAGATPREIAKRLNLDGVKPPRGRNWNASTINGNARRRNGMLLNQLYAGRLVWNKVSMPKDPNTGKRVIRPNPEEAWVIKEVPELAIVPADLFEAAQRRKSERSIGHPFEQRRPKHMLSGLLRCATCGGGLASFGSDRGGRRRVRCSTHTESGTCMSNKTFYVDMIERAVLSGLQTELRTPAVLSEFVKIYHEERAHLAATNAEQQTRLSRRVEQISRKIQHLVNAIAQDHGDPAVLGARMKELVQERTQRETEIALLPAANKVIALHPDVLARYERQVEQLQASLAAGALNGDNDGVAALRELIESVAVQRVPGGIVVTITGRLNAILGEEHFPNDVCGKMVAGAGIEPATYGL
ncbi:MAG: recombinase family protein [Hyphomicrobiales bacterium]|nr:recombinase family protein [Hyphomicrobiales bacterium]